MKHQEPPAALRPSNLAAVVTVPSLPSMVGQLSSMLEDRGASLHDVARLIGQDPAISAKVLRLANSAHYGRENVLVDLHEAASVLGTKVLCAIVLQTSVVTAFASLETRCGDALRAFWRHSTMIARVADHLSRTLSSKTGAPHIRPGDAYTCALLHDFGQLALLEKLGLSYLQFKQSAEEEGSRLHLVEREVLGYDHARVGGLIARYWSLPDQVVQAIARHHFSPRIVSAYPIVLIVQLAEHLADIVDGTARKGAKVVERELLRYLPLSPDELKDALKRASAWADALNQAPFF